MKRKQRLELFHLGRACCWVLLGLYIALFNASLGRSIALVLFLSLYANFGTDISSWQAARAERRSIENPPSSD